MSVSPYILEQKIRFRMTSLRGIFHIGSNIFLEQLLLRVGFMSVAVMAAKMGTDAFAAHQVGMNVMSLSFSFGDGMQVAAVALIGRSLGEEKPDLAKVYGATCQKMGMAISVILAACYLLGGEFLYSLYFKRSSYHCHRGGDYEGDCDYCGIADFSSNLYGMFKRSRRCIVYYNGFYI